VASVAGVGPVKSMWCGIRHGIRPGCRTRHVRRSTCGSHAKLDRCSRHRSMWMISSARRASLQGGAGAQGAHQRPAVPRLRCRGRSVLLIFRRGFTLETVRMPAVPSAPRWSRSAAYRVCDQSRRAGGMEARLARTASQSRGDQMVARRRKRVLSRSRPAPSGAGDAGIVDNLLRFEPGIGAALQWHTSQSGVRCYVRSEIPPGP